GALAGRDAVAMPVGHRLGGHGAVGRQVPPAVEHGHLVPAGVARAGGGQLLALPVAFPVEVLLEGGQLLEPVAVVARSVDVVGARAVAQRHGGHLAELPLEVLGTKAGGVPGDDHGSGHQAPTSAWIAPGPSAVLP